MKNIRILVAAFTTLVVAGCSTPQAWYQPGKSYAETQRDLAECRAAAAMMTPTFTPSSRNSTTVIAQAGYGNQAYQGAAAQNAAAAQGASNSLNDLSAILANNARKNDIIVGLMASKGYSLVDKNSLPAGVKGLPQ